MTKTPQKPGSHDVGYGKPPKHTQFKKGQSGNPSGKRKKEETIQEKLKKLVASEIIVTQNGTPTTMTQLETMLQAIATKAMKGDLPALKFVAEHLGLEPSDLADVPALAVTQADLDVLQTHADWMALIEKAQASMEDSATKGAEDDY